MKSLFECNHLAYLERCLQLKIRIRLFTSLRELVGKRELEFEATHSDKPIIVSILLELLAERYGREFRRYVYDESGKVRDYLQFLVNGRSITQLEGFETRLKENDLVAIIPPVGGG